MTVTYSGNCLDFTRVGEMCHIPVTFQIAVGSLDMEMIRISFTNPNGDIVTPEVSRLISIQWVDHFVIYL